MNAQAFWNVIGDYNEQTKNVQIGLLIFMILAIALSYIRKVNWAAKFALGIVNLFIGIVFFAWYGTEPIQKFFALPLYLLCGILFLYEFEGRMKNVLYISDRYSCSRKKHYGRGHVRKVETSCYFKGYHKRIAV